MGVVVGLSAEARIAARLGYPVRAGGGQPSGARMAAEQLVTDGAAGLISFGLAGALDPRLRPGTIILPSIVLSAADAFQPDAGLAGRFGGLTAHVILGGAQVATSAGEKRRLHNTTRAHAIDLESGEVARTAAAHGLPFLVIRAICDPAERGLPPAALAALDPNGKIGLTPVLRSLLGQPNQIRDLMALARDAARARRALISLARRHQAGPASA